MTKNDGNKTPSQLDENEIKDILLDALIVGADGFKVTHAIIKPYTNGYTVKHKLIQSQPIEPVAFECLWVYNLPNLLYNYLNSVGWTNDDYARLKENVDKAWNALPDKYHANKYTPSKNCVYARHIANGYETDGFYNIVKGKCFGTHMTNTTTAQNELSRELILLKGYCVDLFLKGEVQTSFKLETLKSIYDRHGIDSDFSDIDAWCKRNPTRCSPESEYYQA